MNKLVSKALLVGFVFCYTILANGQEMPPPKPKSNSVPGKEVQQGAGNGKPSAVDLISHVEPVYPPLARQAKIEGTIKLQAIIAKDGSVSHLEVISGHPLLQQAALDAVRQWKYRPTMIDGKRVEVETTVEVKFALSK
jgi:protein TonB